LLAAAPVASRLVPPLAWWIASTRSSISAGVSRPGAPGRVGADVDDADAVVGVEHRHAVPRPDGEPAQQRRGVPGVQRVEHQRRQSEVVHPVDAAGDLDLPFVVGVHLHEHLEAELAQLRRQLLDDGERLRRHERRRAGGLHGVADRVEPDRRDAVLGEQLDDLREVPAGAGVTQVEVHLSARERRPHQPRLAPESHPRERQARSRPVDRQQVGLGRTVGEDAAEGEEHARVRGRVAPGADVGEPRAVRRGVVDDEVDDGAGRPAQRCDVVPGAQARVDLAMVGRVEARVRAVVRPEERQHVDAAEQPGQGTGPEHPGQAVD
jgi:hypothetical protein